MPSRPNISIHFRRGCPEDANHGLYNYQVTAPRYVARHWFYNRNTACSVVGRLHT
jgi:hypothetical protein